jgi:hypothetical protein
MPRDLEEEKPTPAVTLTESPGRVTGSPNQPEEPTPKEHQREFVIIPQDQQYQGPTNLHPYTRPLTISDLESVVALENAAFSDPVERATREKVSFPFPSSNIDLALTRDPPPFWYTHRRNSLTCF